MWQFIQDNTEELGLILASIPIFWAAFQYISLRRFETKKAMFEQYHKIIKDLVQKETEDQPMMLDRQIALIYELRNFKHYYPVTKRILSGLKSAWKNYGPGEKNERLMQEIACTIQYIDNSWFTAKN